MENRDMRRMKTGFGNSRWGALVRFATIAMLLTGCIPLSAMAQGQGQKTFPTAEAAGRALFKAIQSNDEKAMLAVLGQDAKQIVSSGDPVEDQQHQNNFVQKYEEMHRFVMEPDGTTTLYIGAENWPTPIPLMHKGNLWYFDSEEAKREILYRRIGRNEISAIGVCQELVNAQKEYFTEKHEYAQRIFSTAGQQDGLYWKTASGEPQSPIGPLVASAVAEGYSGGTSGTPTPYRGYYFRILTVQGKSGSSAATSYVANGKMTGGFAFVAYPAAYRSSGVVTFIVGSDGVVYQKDLGKNTQSLAKAMKSYDPDSSWQKSNAVQEETASDEKSK